MRALEAQPPEPADRRALVLVGVGALDHQQHRGRLRHPDPRQLGGRGPDEGHVARGEGALEAGVG